MSNLQQDITPEQRLLVLNSLSRSTGWAEYCARQKQVMEQAIDAKVFDPKTPAADREMLVNARQFLVENFRPEKVLQSMLIQLETEVRQAKAKEKAG